mgnify:CR=1 FL=1
MRFQRPPATPLLGCAAILVDFIGLGMIAPILPGIVSSDAVGAILTAQYCAVVLGQVLIGALSDCFGRRRLIVAVMAADAVLFAASGFTQSNGIWKPDITSTAGSVSFVPACTITFRSPVFWLST